MMQTTLPDDFKRMLHDMERVTGCLDSERLIKSLDTPPAVGLRINTRKLPTEFPLYDCMEPVEWCETGYRLKYRPLFTLNPLLHAGAFYVQDPSSMVYRTIVAEIYRLLNLENPDIRPAMLDFCAAPGGKTTAAIDALPDKSIMVANEFDPKRGKILRENLEKWGYPYIITTGDKSGSFSILPEIFDIVAVDAPCSGEGMMRKEEKARNQWSQALIEKCATLQREILSDVVNTLKPGGYLIYSTCTFNLLENEDNAEYIRHELGLTPVRLDIDIPNGATELTGSIPALRFMPHLTDGEGLFVCVFQKSVSSHEIRTTKFSHNNHMSGFSGKRSGNKKRDTEFEYMPENMIGIATPDGLSALHEDMVGIYQLIKDSRIRITGAGLPVGVQKGSVLIPDSRSVLSTLNKDIFPIVDVSEDDALRYLRRESLILPPGIPKGYVTISYKDIPIGLMKNLGNRANNLFHSPWKIRINNS